MREGENGQGEIKQRKERLGERLVLERKKEGKSGDRECTSRKREEREWSEGKRKKRKIDRSA